MKHSAKTEYAAIAVLELARRWGTDEPVRLRPICEAHGVPSRFLVQILLQLKAAGIVTSTRGAAGGYQLARPPADITLEDIVRVFEGPDEPTMPRSRGSRSLSALRHAWGEAADAEAVVLRSITFADVLDRSRAEAMYYI
ncbi:MAG: RrF2 family transcriptional regulator [Planctomycetia bacterium]